MQRCKRYCLQLKVIERCGCFDPLYIESDSDKLGKDPCKLTEGGKKAVRTFSPKCCVRLCGYNGRPSKMVHSAVCDQRDLLVCRYS